MEITRINNDGNPVLEDEVTPVDTRNCAQYKYKKEKNFIMKKSLKN